MLSVVALCAGQGWAALSTLLVPSWLGTHPVTLEVLNGSSIAVAAAGAFVHAGR